MTSLLTTREAFRSISVSRDEPGVLKLRGNPSAASIKKENTAEREKSNHSVKLVLLLTNIFGVCWVTKENIPMGQGQKSWEVIVVGLNTVKSGLLYGTRERPLFPPYPKKLSLCQRFKICREVNHFVI